MTQASAPHGGQLVGWEDLGREEELPSLFVGELLWDGVSVLVNVLKHSLDRLVLLDERQRRLGADAYGAESLNSYNNHNLLTKMIDSDRI